jgi:ABC-type multidrug transport system fused ATPase/permease subunit
MQASTQSEKPVSLKNIVFAFSYWPRIFKILWNANSLHFLLILIFNITRGVIPALLLLASQSIVNTIVKMQGTGSFFPIASAVAVFVGLTLLNEIITIFETHSKSIYQTYISNFVNVEIFKKVGSMSLANFENAYIQDQLQRSQQEANYRPYEIFEQILGILTGFVTLFSSAAILITWNWIIALTLGLIPVLFFFAYLHLGKKEFLIYYSRIPRHRKAWYLTFLLTRDSSFKEAKLNQLHTHFLSEYQSIISGFLKEDKILANKRTGISLFSQLISNILISTIIMYIAYSAFAGKINIGNFVAYISSVTLTFTNSQNIVFNIVDICKNNLYVEQLFNFLDYSREANITESAKHSKSNKKIASNQKIRSIEFRSVSFRYPGTDFYALKGISFELEQGETLAIVGKNGSGKSTLVKLITLLYSDYEGDILINGENIKSFTENQLYKEIGMVFQDFVHYEMSLRNNVGFGDIKNIENDFEINRALENAGLASLTCQLPHYLDTQLGKYFQDGYQLSGGQWQRIAISRAFMRDASLYILDEPSAALDPEAEKDIFKRFNNLVNDRIGIFISHRYTTIRYAHKILVLDGGKIAEMGTHQELMEKDEIYAELYNMQIEQFQTAH